MNAMRMYGANFPNGVSQPQMGMGYFQYPNQPINQFQNVPQYQTYLMNASMGNYGQGFAPPAPISVVPIQKPINNTSDSSASTPKKKTKQKNAVKNKNKKGKKKSQNDESSDSDFSGIENNGIDEERYEGIFERRATRKRASSVNYKEEEIGENIEEIPTSSSEKIEHIYFCRKQNEYLVSFQETSFICQWMNYEQLSLIPNSATHLTRFQSMPIDFNTFITQNDCKPIPIAHRKRITENRYDFLFRVNYENTILFYWDSPTQEMVNLYSSNRIKVDLITPNVNLPLPSPRDNIISNSGSFLRPYQLEGLQWLIKCWISKHGSILADEMGLGKTIQVLAFLAYLNENVGWKGPHIITVRTNCFKQWCDEIEKWTKLKYIPYNAGPQQRKLIRDFQFPFLDNQGSPLPNTIGFNILLVSYDVLLKDSEFLNKYQWQCVIVDEGHRIKNSNGKKNNAITGLMAKHRIILTGTPIQNTLGELWSLLKFVSPMSFSKDPSYIESDIDIENLSTDVIKSFRQIIAPHILRRTVSEAEHQMAPKEERVAFIQISDTQQELMRLIKLHALWRLKGVQTNENTIDTSHESSYLRKVCSHPFMIDGANEYYTKKFRLPRLELLLKVSSKFEWLDKTLTYLKANGHRVLIFSQSVKLLRLLKEYCDLKDYSHEMLIGSMSDSEKTASISRFADDSSTSFIFLISTRAGSEGLNLTVADTAIIFDPDWNPQNDLQAQARCHRIGQTQKVNVIRLLTYQTYEHEMFVRAQKKLELWLTLLGSKNTEAQESTIPSLIKPPNLYSCQCDFSTLNSLLETISTVVSDFSLSALKVLEKPLEETILWNNCETDEQLIDRFPVELDEGLSRRMKRSRTRELSIGPLEAKEIFDLFKKYGYNKWNDISSSVPEYTNGQIERFCLCILVYALRSQSPTIVLQYPFILSVLQYHFPDFVLDLVICNNRVYWDKAITEEHDFYSESECCLYLKEELFENGNEFLQIIEMKMEFNYWSNFKDVENVSSKLLNLNIQEFQSNVTKVISFSSFNPLDLGLQETLSIIRAMILEKQDYSHIYTFSWWTANEIAVLLDSLQKYCYSIEDPIGFHSKTNILTKPTSDVSSLATYIRHRLMNFHDSVIEIPTVLSHISDAPEEVIGLKAVFSYPKFNNEECESLLNRIVFLETIKEQILMNYPIFDGYSWDVKKCNDVLDGIYRFGIENIQSIAQKTFSPSEIPWVFMSLEYLIRFFDEIPYHKHSSKSKPISLYIPPISQINYIVSSKKKLQIRNPIEMFSSLQIEKKFRK